MPTIGNTPRPGYVYDQETDTWIPIGVGPHTHSYVDLTLIDAKGDLLVGSSADTVSKLTTGNNGESLVVDSSTSTGLRWSGTTTQNPVLNSSFDIWQRGTSFTGLTSSTYVADRWNIGTNGTYNGYVSRQLTNDSTNLPDIQYCARIGRTSGNTNTNFIIFNQSIETADSIRFAGKTLTLSFYARRGTNFSPTNNTLNVYLRSGTGTDQNGLSTVTGSNYFLNTTTTLTTTWQRYSFTGVMPATATQLFVELDFAPTGTAGANDFWEVTGIQIDVGSVATPYRRAMNTLAGEYLACARYYQKSYNLGTAPGTDTNDGLNYSAWSQAATTTGYLSYEIVYPVRMRTAATVVTYDVADASGKVSRVTPAGADQNGLTPSTAFGNEVRILIQSASGNSHAGLALHWTASAEL